MGCTRKGSQLFTLQIESDLPSRYFAEFSLTQMVQTTEYVNGISIATDSTAIPDFALIRAL